MRNKPLIRESTGSGEKHRIKISEERGEDMKFIMWVGVTAASEMGGGSVVESTYVK